MSTFWWEKAQQLVIELEDLKYQVKAVWSVVMTVMSVILDAVYQKIKKEEKGGGGGLVDIISSSFVGGCFCMHLGNGYC